MSERGEPMEVASSGDKNARLLAIQRPGVGADPQSFSLLVAALHDEPAMCAAAIDALGEARNVQAIKPLAELLNAADVAMRTRAVRALRQIGGPLVIDALVHALQNDMPQVRRAAIVALGKLRDARSLSLLISMLQDQDTRVRASAILTLAELGDEGALSALMEIQRSDIHDDARQLREYAAYAIRRIHEQCR